MWAVGPFLINGAAVDVMRAWGFEPSSIITWAKWNPKKNSGYGGVGFWFLGNAEFVIVGKRPGWPSIRTGRSSLIVHPKMEHSRKPDAVHEICEACFPGPYVEIFGRRERKGWTVLGNEAPGDGMDTRAFAYPKRDGPA
jgi:N6-adenosine-specific RNA methylase IME4